LGLGWKLQLELKSCVMGLMFYIGPTVGAKCVEDGCCPFKIVFDEDLYVVFDEDLYVLFM